jgi:hypothetical protein
MWICGMGTRTMWMSLLPLYYILGSELQAEKNKQQYIRIGKEPEWESVCNIQKCVKFSVKEKKCEWGKINIHQTEMRDVISVECISCLFTVLKHIKISELKWICI